MSFINQLTVSRNELIATLTKSKDNSIRAINDAESDATARFERLRLDVEAEYKAAQEAVYEALGKPEGVADKVDDSFVTEVTS